MTPRDHDGGPVVDGEVVERYQLAYGILDCMTYRSELLIQGAVLDVELDKIHHLL